MREIIFRGKRVDNGKWVYGLLARVSADVSNIVEKKFDILTPIYTNTVGQYTGLTDKNGKKIFERDIVKVGTQIYMIKWNNRQSSFDFYCINGDMQGGCNEDTLKLCEYIGNIFDNPELIKEK